METPQSSRHQYWEELPLPDPLFDVSLLRPTRDELVGKHTTKGLTELAVNYVLSIVEPPFS
jgi:hypothetical protein